MGSTRKFPSQLTHLGQRNIESESTQLFDQIAIPLMPALLMAQNPRTEILLGEPRPESNPEDESTEDDGNPAMA